MTSLKALAIFLTVILMGLLIVLVKLVYFSPAQKSEEKPVQKEDLFDSFKTLGSEFGDIIQDTKQGTDALREFMASISNTNTALPLSDEEVEVLRQKLLERQAKEKAARAEQTRISDVLSDEWEVAVQEAVVTGIPDAKFLLRFEKDKECRKILAFYEKGSADEMRQKLAEQNQGRLEQQCKLGIFSENKEYIMIDTCVNDVRCEGVEDIRSIFNYG